MREGGKEAMVLAAAGEALTAALLRNHGLEPLNAEGRGGVYRFPCDGGDGVLRRMRRGGLPGRFLKDRYLLTNRPLAEFEMHLALFRRGVPCPEPLGVAWEKQGLWYCGALATRLVSGPSLQAVLLGAPIEVLLPEALAAAGRAVAKLHAAGGLHADLHPANILLARGEAFLIDFDRARLLDAPAPGQRASNLLRLRRAFVKHGFDLKHFDAFMAGYGPVPGHGRLQAALAAAHEAAVKPTDRDQDRGDAAS